MQMVVYSCLTTWYNLPVLYTKLPYLIYFTLTKNYLNNGFMLTMVLLGLMSIEYAYCLKKLGAVDFRGGGSNFSNLLESLMFVEGCLKYMPHPQHPLIVNDSGINEYIILWGRLWLVYKFAANNMSSMCCWTYPYVTMFIGGKYPTW